jgi:nucleoside-diphosphate-sugar epimerase
MAKTALILGGTGLLGAGIARELLAAGWDVTCLARGQKRSLVADVPTIHADRTVPGQLAAAVRGRAFDLVVDAAALSADHVEDAIATFRDSVGHYVFISTDFVYAAVADALYQITEDAPKQISQAYAAGKLAGEAALARAWEQARFPSTTLRPPHILGAGKPLGCDPLAMRDPQLVAKMRAGKPIPLVADGQMLIQPVWSREVGRCIAAIAGNHGAFGQVCNCAGADCVTAERYYAMIAERVGVPLKVRPVPLTDFIREHPDKAHMARHRIYDLSRLRSLGFSPTLTLTDAIGETLEWAERQTANATR